MFGVLMESKLELREVERVIRWDKEEWKDVSLVWGRQWMRDGTRK